MALVHKGEVVIPKEKVLSVSEIRKSKSSYGNYSFDLEIQTPKFKTNKTIFEFGLKKITEVRNKYLQELKYGN